MPSLFWPLVVLSQLFAGAMLVTMVIWLQHHVGGFVWGAPGGYHPLLLTLSLVFLFGEALISFRVLSRCRLPYLAQKAIHASVHTVIIILLIAGLRAAALAKDAQEIHGVVHNHSLHSWLGYFTVILFCLQFVAGCAYYGAERFLRQDHPLRAHYPQVHVFFGIFMFSLSLASCLTGLNELSIYKIAEYSSGVASGNIGNIYGMSMVLFGGSIAFIVTRSEYKTDKTSTQNIDSPQQCQAAYHDALPNVHVMVGDDITDDVTDDVMDGGDGLRMQSKDGV
ncbi:cytochrome b561-like [Patiria miniata]|uniref:Cytochrome b561 domain-containing protein n=1 Tax=Patiria miniata TaxID=46514 RepID=A0A914BRA9_PATMI|nr:cytochrome b561-like [Patiria miniata]XP_038078697.1 cytochrome b561-like [Patiria miniata]XP_038078698.1 cytochrome b561-like [Patiria miniata]XP_038078699.1 cytochrome b561-like [Patiria miniata]